MPPQFTIGQVTRLWLARQGLLNLETKPQLDRRSFVDHLERTGGLQVDSVNVVDRAHYLTLWSRFGNFDRREVDRWIYEDKLAYEYWGHEASILPISHLPHGLRRMKRFPPQSWQSAAYWQRYDTSIESKKRVLKMLQRHGPLESIDFERSVADLNKGEILGWGSVIPKEDKRSLQLLWHAGKVAVAGRRHFRKVYDLSNRIYPTDTRATSMHAYHDSWLLIGLAGCGIASESHLINYITGPKLNAFERTKIIDRAVNKGVITEVRVAGCTDRFYALPEHIDEINALPEPSGTTLICPFDSLLWQRKRAEDLLDFRYRVEIYLPEAKRQFGYYVLPILHNGRLVGRLDPKLHRERACLQIKSLHWESAFQSSRECKKALRCSVESLAGFLNARRIQWPT